jgi:hypothetical protein
MKSENELFAEALAAMPVPTLPRATAERTLAHARGCLAPPPNAGSGLLLQRLPAHAVSAALISADAVFFADACLKMARIFGG